MVLLVAVAMIFLLHQTVMAEAVAVIHVYDETGSSKRLILGATREAEFILRKSGVRTEWRLCGTWDDSRCDRREQPNLLSLTITNREDGIASTTALGFALPFTEAADKAAAILPRIEQFVKFADPSALRNTLAAVMAHEIGHLLLHSNEHGEGIMSARWDATQRNQMARRMLRFTPDQSRALRAGLQRRLGGAVADAAGY